MPKMTQLARISDGLPLAASMEEEKDQKAELEDWKSQAKKIVRQIGPGSPSKLSIDIGSSFFHYLTHGGVCYLTLTDRGYPKRLAFNYLEELQQEFDTRYNGQVEGASRPYAFIKFDPFIQKTRRLYVDTRTQRNLNKLNEDLNDVQRIMTQNIQDVLGRGERLDSVVSKSSDLRNASSKYAKDARYLNTQVMLRKYVPRLPHAEHTHTRAPHADLHCFVYARPHTHNRLRTHTRTTAQPLTRTHSQHARLKCHTSYHVPHACLTTAVTTSSAVDSGTQVWSDRLGAAPRARLPLVALPMTAEPSRHRRRRRPSAVAAPTDCNLGAI